MSLKIYRYEVDEIGKYIKGSKQKYLWDFAVNGRRHTVILEYSQISSKRRIIIDGFLKYEQEDSNMAIFQYSFTVDDNQCNIVQQGNGYELRINNKVFSHEYNQQRQQSQFKWDANDKNNEEFAEFRIDNVDKDDFKKLNSQVEGQKVKMTLNLGKTDNKNTAKPQNQSNNNDFSNFNFNDFGNQQKNNNTNTTNSFGAFGAVKQTNNSNNDFGDFSNFGSFQNQNKNSSNTQNDFNFSSNNNTNKQQNFTISPPAQTVPQKAQTQAPVQQDNKNNFLFLKAKQIDLLDMDDEPATIGSNNQNTQVQQNQGQFDLFNQQPAQQQPQQQQQTDLMSLYGQQNTQQQPQQNAYNPFNANSQQQQYQNQQAQYYGQQQGYYNPQMQQVQQNQQNPYQQNFSTTQNPQNQQNNFQNPQLNPSNNNKKDVLDDLFDF